MSWKREYRNNETVYVNGNFTIFRSHYKDMFTKRELPLREQRWYISYGPWDNVLESDSTMREAKETANAYMEAEAMFKAFEQVYSGFRGSDVNTSDEEKNKNRLNMIHAVALLKAVYD